MRLMPAINTKVVAIESNCCVQRQSDGTLDYWQPTRTGDWTNDNNMGRIYALRTIEYINREQSPIAMVSILRAMMQKGVYSGTEAGFLAAMIAHLIERVV